MTLFTVKDQITVAANLAGRQPSEIQLIAVSKQQPNERVQEVLDEGQQVFGENRVQEAAGKWPEFRQNFSNVKLHLIGPLQTNKVKQAFGLFDVIHSVDRMKLATKLATEAHNAGYAPDMFIQVNTGEEPQKAGILPENADEFIKSAIAMDLPIKGLMVIPPVDEHPSLHFGLLRNIAKRNGLSGLSMGMSSDFEHAIALGATHIRVGSAIFGDRAVKV